MLKNSKSCSTTYPRLLIIGTVPYDNQFTSRSFRSYFQGWNRDSLYQIYSNEIKPLKGHCGEFYQITDRNIIQSKLRKRKLGAKYLYDELDSERSKSNVDEGGFLTKLKILLISNKSPFVYLCRKLLWGKNVINDQGLEKWVNNFNPEAIFLSFSDDFFILELAKHFSKKKNIPIIAVIGDDYFFNERRSFSPFYYLYRKLYKRLVRSVFTRNGNNIYISDKIRMKYDGYFNKKGETVYLTSEIIPRDFRPINHLQPKINYFGNIGLGRAESIIEISKKMKCINENAVINVYSSEIDKVSIRNLKAQSNIKFMGSISYSETKEKMQDSDLLLIVEGLDDQNMLKVKYSLSTKIADSLASGVNLFCLGAKGAGAVDYLQENDACVVCTDIDELENKLNDFLYDENLQHNYYEKGIDLYRKNHILSRSLSQVKDIVKREVEANE